MKYSKILVLTLISLLLASCMEYDMSYPRIPAEFTEFSVAEAEDVVIDPSAMTVNIILKESADLANVRIDSLKLNDKAFFKDGAMPSVLDLRKPYEVTLSMYQDYLWIIKAEQQVERYVRCSNQVGEAFVDVIRREVFVNVSDSQRLKYLQINDMKLELEGSTVVSTTGVVVENNTTVMKTEECAFPMILDCTVKRSFDVLSRGETTTWKLTAIPVAVPAQIVKVASWCWSADVFATFDGTSSCPVFKYRKTSDEQWLEVAQEDVVVEGVNVTAHIKGLEQETGYEVKLVFEGEELPGETFVTDRPLQLPNMNFDQWWLDGAVWYPYAQDAPEADRVWDSANKGAAQFIGSSTLPEDEDVVKGKAARLVSKWAAVKFAAGNLYTGKFNNLVGMSGADLDWGVPFTSKPKALRGWYKYEPQLITRKNNALVSGTEMDKCQLQVLLIDSERPYKILPVGGMNGPTYDGVMLDLETEPTVIARGIVNLEGTDKDGDGKAEWVEIILPFEYRDYRTPKYVIVTAASSYLGDYFTGGEGSTMLVDEFEFIYE